MTPSEYGLGCRLACTETREREELRKASPKGESSQRWAYLIASADLFDLSQYYGEDAVWRDRISPWR
jgi:hypothetical protein